MREELQAELPADITEQVAGASAATGQTALPSRSDSTKGG